MSDLGLLLRLLLRLLLGYIIFVCILVLGGSFRFIIAKCDDFSADSNLMDLEVGISVQ